jgi:hypothetical protein
MRTHQTCSPGYEYFHTVKVVHNSLKPLVKSILNINSFGGHNFWLYDVNWKQRIYNNNIIQFNIPNKIVEGFNEHRGGWDTIKKSNPSFFTEKFYKMWEFYLLSSMIMFEIKHIQLSQYVFTKRSYPDMYIFTEKIA